MSDAPRKAALQDLLAKVEAGEVLQANETSIVWPTTYDKASGENLLPWRDARRASQGSLDAAMALHEAVLPGWVVNSFMWWVDLSRIGLCETHEGRDGGRWHGGQDKSSEAEANTPARAWLIAILKALIAREGET